MTGYMQVGERLYPNSYLPDGKIIRQVSMSTYEVGTSSKGTGYVSCPDEWAPRKVHWHPYVISPDGVHIDLPSEPYRSWAEDAVREYLAGET
jgi:hypothetical protein